MRSSSARASARPRRAPPGSSPPRAPPRQGAALLPLEPRKPLFRGGPVTQSMARDTDPTTVTEIRPASSGTGSIRLRKRARPRDLWERALDRPLLWLAAFLILGTWCLQPGAFHFANRAQPNTIADHDYVASRDLLLNDDEATVKKQREARDAVLPIYDLDPGALAA